MAPLDVPRLNTFSNRWNGFKNRVNTFANKAREFGEKIHGGLNTFRNNARKIHNDVSGLPILGDLYRATPLHGLVSQGLDIADTAGNLIDKLSEGKTNEALNDVDTIAGNLIKRAGERAWQNPYASGINGNNHIRTTAELHRPEYRIRSQK